MSQIILGEVPEAMQRLRCGKSKLYQLIRRGDVQAVKLDRRTLVVMSSVDDYIERLVAEQSDPAPAA